ncbi:MAG: zinc metalloprotease HtpX [Syntrophaceticus sp.]|nr:zinc metalloprotease HtpX [Syntrophaceticus sp.]MDD4359983.1 zinc metalloprotease HtpX [Syntrophaceticus sp.]MDD4783243.1 zinc metalloprotease HtpX [Syntrophaceticus sp.]
MSRSRFPVDHQLKARMFFTLFLLAALYLLFGVVLWSAGVGFSAIIVIVAIMMLAQYFLSDKLVLMSTGAKVVSPQEAPELHSIVERLSMLADMPKPRVAIMPTSVPNAFATGRNPQNAVVAVTEGLMRQLTTQEVEAVLAHEISHVKNRDVSVMTIASFFATVASFIVQNFFFISMGQDRENRGAGVLIYFVSLLVYLISFFLIRALSRYREYSADRGAAFLTGAPGMLSSALKKISGTMKRVPEQDLRQAEGMNAFYILPALTGDTFAELLSTHPSLEKRLAYLRKLEREMRG